MIMDDVLKAMLGDREAQQRLTEKGELIFCPKCGASARFKVLTSSQQGTSRGWNFHIYCTECGFHTKIYELSASLTSCGEIEFLKDERKDAIAEWNDRFSLLTMKQIKRLEEMERVCK